MYKYAQVYVGVCTYAYGVYMCVEKCAGCESVYKYVQVYVGVYTYA